MRVARNGWREFIGTYILEFDRSRAHRRWDEPPGRLSSLSTKIRLLLPASVVQGKPYENSQRMLGLVRVAYAVHTWQLLGVPLEISRVPRQRNAVVAAPCCFPGFRAIVTIQEFPLVGCLHRNSIVPGSTGCGAEACAFQG